MVWLVVRKPPYAPFPSLLTYFTLVLGYKAAFPWSSPDSELNHESMQINLFGTASYLSIDADGLQNLAIFSNLADTMVEPVREKWEESLQLSSINTRSALLPHFTMIGISLHQLMDVVKYQEFMQGTLVRFHIWLDVAAGSCAHDRID